MTAKRRDLLWGGVRPVGQPIANPPEINAHCNSQDGEHRQSANPQPGARGWRWAGRRQSRRSFLQVMGDRSNEAVALAGQGLNELGILGRIAEGFAQVEDCFVQAAIEIHKGAGGPEPAHQCFP